MRTHTSMIVILPFSLMRSQETIRSTEVGKLWPRDREVTDKHLGEEHDMGHLMMISN